MRRVASSKLILKNLWWIANENLHGLWRVHDPKGIVFSSASLPSALDMVAYNVMYTVTF